MATEPELAYRAGALALKRGLKYSDLPHIPHTGLIHFRPPLNGPDGCLHHEYDLGTGPPLPKDEAIAILADVIDFGLKLEQFTRRLYRERAVIERPLRRVDGAPTWFGFRTLPPSEWTIEMVRVLDKWSRVKEREDELDAWVADAVAWTVCLKEAVGVVDDPVVGDL